MAIGSCSSCSSGNPVTQYLQQLNKPPTQEELIKRAQQDPDDPASRSKPGQAVDSTRPAGPTVNGQGQPVGALVNATA